MAFFYLTKNGTMELPIYKAVIYDNDETGIETISLVDLPAVESDFLVFSKEQKQEFAIQDEEQRKVFGVVMKADYPIYRRNPDGYEYYIVYDRKTIELMAEKFLRLSRQNNVDLQHDFEIEEGIYLNEMFIKDTERGISPKGFEDVKDGSLFAIYHIVNDDVWASVKEGTYRGFSLSGLFDVEKVEFNKQSNNDITMKLNRIKELARKILCEFGEVATDKGILVWDGDEDLKAGDLVRIMDAEGNETAAEDGEYVTDDRKTIIVAEGKVAEIRDPEAEVEPEEIPNPQPQENAPEDTPNPEENAPEAEQEPDEKDARIKELEAEIAAKDARIAELEAKVAELEKEPAGESAEEAFRKQSEKTVDKDSASGKMRSRGYKF